MHSQRTSRLAHRRRSPVGKSAAFRAGCLRASREHLVRPRRFVDGANLRNAALLNIRRAELRVGLTKKTLEVQPLEAERNGPSDAGSVTVYRACLAPSKQSIGGSHHVTMESRHASRTAKATKKINGCKHGVQGDRYAPACQ